MDKHQFDVLNYIIENQNLFDFVIKQTTKRIIDLEYRVGSLWIDSQASEITDLNRRIAQLDVELLCQKNNIQYFKEKLEENKRFKVKIGKLFKKTYKRVNKFDKKLKNFYGRVEILADNSIKVLNKQVKNENFNQNDLEELIKNFENLKMTDY